MMWTRELAHRGNHHRYQQRQEAFEEGRETESAKTSKFTVPNSTFGDKRQSLWLVGEPDVRKNYGMGSRI